MSQIQITVDESIIELLGDSPKEIERSALEIIVLDLYRRHAISVGRAAEILGLDCSASFAGLAHAALRILTCQMRTWNRNAER